MNYRINKRTGDRISEIGFGSAYLFEAGMNEGVCALQTAVEGGVNYFALCLLPANTVATFLSPKSSSYS